MSKTKPFDCVIIGGGVIGTMLAWELTKAQKRCAIVERRTVGQESSWAGGGILQPLYPWREDPAVHPLARWGQEHYAQIARELFQISGIDPEWLPSGLLVFDAEELAAAQECSERYGYGMEVISRSEAQNRFPHVRIPQELALWFPQAGQIRPPRLMQALRKALEKLGAVIFENQTARALTLQGQCVDEVITAAQTIPGKTFLVASGAWSAEFLASLDISLPTEPVRGQMLLYQAAPNFLENMVLRNGHYLVPRRDGLILSGSTLEYVGFDKSLTPNAYAELKCSAEAIAPQIRQFPITHHWSGLRPGSPNGVPIISRIAQVENLFISAGHFRNGILFAPASAEIMASLILERAPKFDAQPYTLEFQTLA